MDNKLHHFLHYNTYTQSPTSNTAHILPSGQTITRSSLSRLRTTKEISKNNNRSVIRWLECSHEFFFAWKNTVFRFSLIMYSISFHVSKYPNLSFLCIHKNPQESTRIESNPFFLFFLYFFSLLLHDVITSSF